MGDAATAAEEPEPQEGIEALLARLEGLLTAGSAAAEQATALVRQRWRAGGEPGLRAELLYLAGMTAEYRDAIRGVSRALVNVKVEAAMLRSAPPPEAGQPRLRRVV
jgi:hypothetical protein